MSDRCSLSLVVVSLCALLGGCQPGRLMEFGPMATVSATDIMPGCEGATPLGEFSTEIRYGFPEDMPSGDLLLDVDRAVLGDGDMMVFPLNESVALDDGDTVCVWSSGTEEHDTFDNDSLNEAQDCQEVDESTVSTVFALDMTSGGCTLSVRVPAVVSTP